MYREVLEKMRDSYQARVTSSQYRDLPTALTITDFAALRQPFVVMGGSFDPIHYGHLINARAILEKLKLAVGVLIPCGRNPLKVMAPQGSDNDRLAMIEGAIAEEPGLYVSPVELGGSHAVPSFTVETLRKIRKEIGNDGSLYLAIGVDLLSQLHRWREVDELFNLATLVVTEREGISAEEIVASIETLTPDQKAMLIRHVVPVPKVAISATQIRGAVRQAEECVDALPDAAVRIIKSRNLYAETSL